MIKVGVAVMLAVLMFVSVVIAGEIQAMSIIEVRTLYGVDREDVPVGSGTLREVVIEDSFSLQEGYQPPSARGKELVRVEDSSINLENSGVGGSMEESEVGVLAGQLSPEGAVEKEKGFFGNLLDKIIRFFID